MNIVDVYNPRLTEEEVVIFTKSNELRDKLVEEQDKIISNVDKKYYEKTTTMMDFITNILLDPTNPIFDVSTTTTTCFYSSSTSKQKNFGDTMKEYDAILSQYIRCPDNTNSDGGDNNNPTPDPVPETPNVQSTIDLAEKSKCGCGGGKPGEEDGNVSVQTEIHNYVADISSVTVVRSLFISLFNFKDTFDSSLLLFK